MQEEGAIIHIDFSNSAVLPEIHAVWGAEQMLGTEARGQVTCMREHKCRFLSHRAFIARHTRTDAFKHLCLMLHLPTLSFTFTHIYSHSYSHSHKVCSHAHMHIPTIHNRQANTFSLPQLPRLSRLPHLLASLDSLALLGSLNFLASRPSLLSLPSLPSLSPSTPDPPFPPIPHLRSLNSLTSLPSLPALHPHLLLLIPRSLTRSHSPSLPHSFALPLMINDRYTL